MNYNMLNDIHLRLINYEFNRYTNNEIGNDSYLLVALYN